MGALRSFGRFVSTYTWTSFAIALDTLITLGLVV